jgi:hypothetical protein
MDTRQLTASDLRATEPVLTEDAIIGIDRALSKYDELLQKAIDDGADGDRIADLLAALRAAQSWLMHVQAMRGHDPE